MQQNNLRRQFLTFVLPSMLTMLLNGLYTIVDGFFIGHAVGDTGLAGIGLVWPVTAVLMALGVGIGAGGSVLMSTRRGAGDDAGANRARANTILLLLLASIVMTILLVLLGPAIVAGLGARGEVYDAAMSYVHVIARGGGMQIIASGLIPIIRNSNKTVQAMLIMGSGLVSNILLDALLTLVIPWGLRGAAIATILGQTITVLCAVACLLKLKEHKLSRAQFVPDRAAVASILKIGVSPFGLSLMPSLVTVFNNWQCLAYGGEQAVSAYAVANYFIASVLLLLEGIGEGMQPLVSFYRGAGDAQSMRRIRRYGLTAVLAFSGAFLLLSLPARSALPRLFGTTPQTAAIIGSALPILCAAFPLLGIGKLFTSYFYAGGNTVSSTLLVYSDPLVFTPLCILLLPRVFGLRGVWMALPTAQLLVMLLLTALLLCHTIGHKQKGAVSVECRADSLS